MHIIAEENEIVKVHLLQRKDGKPTACITIQQGQAGKAHVIVTCGDQTHEIAIDGAIHDAPAGVRIVPDDDEIQAWADRHDLKGGITDLRCAFEDAESWEAP